MVPHAAELWKSNGMLSVLAVKNTVFLSVYYIQNFSFINVIGFIISYPLVCKIVKGKILIFWNE